MRTILLTAIVCVICCAAADSQGTVVSWADFNSGFSESTIRNTAIAAVVGYPFIQSSSNGNSRIISGFLVDSLFTNGSPPPYSGPVYSFQKWIGGQSVDAGNSVALSRDSGYVICGVYGTNGGRMYVIKLDQRGDTMWTKQIISEGQGASGGESIIATSDGGYAVAGWGAIPFTAITGVYLVKLDADGDTLWTRWWPHVPTVGYTVGHDVRQTFDGGYIIAGNTSNYSPTSTFIVKTDSLGAEMWVAKIAPFDFSYPVAVEQLSDSGYVFGGWGQSPYTILMFAIRLNSDGSLKWQKTYSPGGAICCSRGYDIKYTTDNGFILVGATTPNYQGGEMIYVVKTDSTGDTLWTKTYSRTVSDQAYAVRQTFDGGYVLTGYSGNPINVGQADVFLMKLDENGDSIWMVTYGGSVNDFGNAVVQSIDGGYIIAGQTYSFGNYTDVYIVKGDENGIVTDVRAERSDNSPSAYRLDQNYPNPFNPATAIGFHIANSGYVTLKVYDVLGREVASLVSEFLVPGSYVRTWNAGNNASGVYFCRLVAGVHIQVQKMMVVK